jgi:hypothetical protein
MFPFQLGDFALPEIAVRQLRVRNGQVRLSHRHVAVPHDIEVEGPRPPPLAAFSAPLALDAAAVLEERRRLQGGFEQNHLIQIWRLRNRSEGRRLLDSGCRDQPGAGKRAEPCARIRQVCRAIAQIGAEGDKGAFN